MSFINNGYDHRPSNDADYWFDNNHNNTTTGNRMPPPPSYQESILADAHGNGGNHHAIELTLEQNLANVLRQHEINYYYAEKMMKLKAFKIVFVFDDSGSMCSTLSDSPLNTNTFRATRWDELQYFANISIEVTNVFNNEGCDVYFLNRAPVKCVRSMEQLRPSFEQKPAGYTPLTGVLNTILYENSRSERQLLIIIVTDGEPTNNTGHKDIQSFKQFLKHRPRNVFTTIVACTDEQDLMEYLNNWDRNIPRLDVLDDYRSEKKEANRKRQHSSGTSLTFGDYVAKSLIGSIDQSLDKLDENLVNPLCTLL
jgi:hypothetical protein